MPSKTLTWRSVPGSTPLRFPALLCLRTIWVSLGESNPCNSGSSTARCQQPLVPTKTHVPEVTRPSLTQVTSVGSSTGP